MVKFYVYIIIASLLHINKFINFCYILLIGNRDHLMDFFPINTQSVDKSSKISILYLKINSLVYYIKIISNMQKKIIIINNNNNNIY